jgi:hypothetical protein
MCVDGNSMFTTVQMLLVHDVTCINGLIGLGLPQVQSWKILIAGVIVLHHVLSESVYQLHLGIKRQGRAFTVGPCGPNTRCVHPMLSSTTFEYECQLHSISVAFQVPVLLKTYKNPLSIWR